MIHKVLGAWLAVAVSLFAQTPADQATVIADVKKAGGAVEFHEKEPGRPIRSINY